MTVNIVYFFDKVFWPPREGCHHPPCGHLHYLAKSGLPFRVVLLVQPHEEPLVSAFLAHYSHLDVRTVKVSDLGARVTDRYKRLKKEHTFHSMLDANALAVNHPGLRDELARANIFFTNYVYTTPFLEHIPRHAFSIVETHDIQSLQLTCLMAGGQNVSAYGRTPAGQALFERLFCEEIALLDRFDSVIAIAGDEAEILARSLLEGKVTYIPPVVVNQNPTSSKSEPQYDLVFVAGHHPPNVRSIQEFYRDCFLPYLKPYGVRMALVGKVGPLSGIDDASVINLGFVQNLEDAYQRARVAICPIHYGAGCSIKTLEALTYGKAVVATPLALRGLNVNPSRLLVASEAKTFARHVMSLLVDVNRLKFYELQSRDELRVGHSYDRYERLLRNILSRALRRTGERVKAQQFL
jgi:hypothetical protein